MVSQQKKERPMDEGTDWAVRELFKLPKTGDLFDHLAQWDEERVVGEIRLQNAVHNVLAEPIYEEGKRENGISVRFLMRLTMLANEARLKGYGSKSKVVKEAVALLGDPGQANTTENVAAPRYQPQCLATSEAYWVKPSQNRC